MSFSKNDLDKIKTQISIRSELEKKTKIIQKGKDCWCCCPFHEEKTPSCKINDDTNSFYCFGCGAKGDIFTLYTDLYNYSFIDAVKELSKKAGIEISFDNTVKTKQENKIEEILNITSLWFQKNLSSSSANKCNEYLKERKLTNQTIEKFKLGYSSNSEISLYEFLKDKGFKDEDLLESNVVKLDKNNKIRDFFYKRLIFPILNIQGRVVGFGGRALDDSNPKYINSPESKIFQKRYLLYNLNLARNNARKKNNLLICEGYMDVISLYQNGIESVVAPLGTALTENQIQLSWQYSSKPTIMFDGDDAGIRASYKAAILALPLISAQKFIQFISLPKGFDPDTFINKVSLNKFVTLLKEPIPLIIYIFEHSSKTIKFENVDEKISYDKYIDDLVETIKDNKTKYFYKNEFKNLFFNKIRLLRSPDKISFLKVNKINTSLYIKEIYSFIACIINHKSIRKQIIDALLLTELLSSEQANFLNDISLNNYITQDSKEITDNYRNKVYKKLIFSCINDEIYQLFPYSQPTFDPKLAYEEVLKSMNNLNTRLLNLKKINKSLDSFANNSNLLNWKELQNINLEILNDD